LNDSGIVAGGAGEAAWKLKACTWRFGVKKSLEPISIPTRIYGVNDRGSIVGEITGDHEIACLWADGRLHELGKLGGTNAAALAINNAEQIVGLSNVDGGVNHAFVYE